MRYVREKKNWRKEKERTKKIMETIRCIKRRSR